MYTHTYTPGGTFKYRSVQSGGTLSRVIQCNSFIQIVPVHMYECITYGTIHVDLIYFLLYSKKFEKVKT